MSELQFPKNPTTGQEYDFPPYKYYWDGEKWKTKGVGYNPVNDLRDELEPRISTSESRISDNESRISDNESKVFDALRRSYAEAGLNLVEGNFEEGGELLAATDVMITASGDGYAWTGAFPKVVAPGTDPAAVAGFVMRSYAGLRSELASSGGAGMIGGLPFVSPLHFGGVPGGLVDSTQAIKDAIDKSALHGYVLDLRGGPWLFSATLDLTGVKTIIADFSGRLLCNPVGFTAGTSDYGSWAVTIGKPTGGFGANRSVGCVILGSLVVESLNRSSGLDGVYLKGSWFNVGHIRAYNFNGHGV